MSEPLPVTGNTEHTKPENRAFYPALDGLRAFAFLLVFFQHYLGLPWGWTGVDLFFVLSGFLITGILYDTQNDTHRVRNFYLRRTLRIFPLYYGIMLVVAVTWPLLRWQLSWLWLAWPLYLGNFLRFLHPYQAGSLLQRTADFQPISPIHHAEMFLGHFWSLCIEEQFYLFWPWVVFSVRDRRRLLSLCAVSVPVCLALRLWAAHVAPSWAIEKELLYRATPFRLDALLLGGALAMALRGPHAASILRFAYRILSAVIIAGAVYVAYLTAEHGVIQPPTAVQAFTWRLTVVDAIAALLILSALLEGSMIWRIFRLRPLRWLGRISYGAYVFHDIFHYGVSRWAARHVPGDPVTATWMIALPLTIGVAWLSFRYFESPFLNLKERWTVRGALRR